MINDIKIAFIWTRMPPYAIACLSNLKKIIGNNLFIGIYGQPPAHVSKRMLSSLGNYKNYNYVDDDKLQIKRIINDLELFNPQVIIVTGWSFKTLRLVSKYFRNQNKITVSMIDTPWKGTFKQTFRALIGKRILKKCFSKVWIPGIQSKFLMNFIGFKDQSVWDYLYCCDTNIYIPEFNKEKSKYFIFIGRLEKEKNIIGLVDAFKEFYKNNLDYKLIVVGDGSERYLFEGVKGIECLGWKRSHEIVKYLNKSNGFILPSIYEPWGVVVHEAASCGIPLLLSNKIGSKHEFLINNYNGRLFNPYDKFDIVSAMNFVKNNNINNIMGKRSYEISKRLNIDSWTKNFLMNIKDCMK